MIIAEGVWRWSEEHAECICAATHRWIDGGRSFYYTTGGGEGGGMSARTDTRRRSTRTRTMGSGDELHTICGTQLTRRRTADVLPSLDGGL